MSTGEPASDVEPEAAGDEAGVEAAGDADDEAGVEAAEDGEAGLPLPPLPDGLLGPLLDSAGEALRRLPPDGLPAAARRLRTFDRRGLATPAARHQLRRLLEEDEDLLAAAAAVLLARAEAARLATAWEEATAAGGDAPLGLVSGAAADGRLPLLASVLAAGLPAGFEFGLGLVVAMAAVAGRESDAAAAVRAAAAGQATAEEAQRRAEAARSAAEAEAARLDAALREERRGRRQLEQQSADTATGAEARRTALEGALAEAERRVAAADQRAASAEQRAAAADQRAASAEQRAVSAEQQAADAVRRAADAEGRAAAMSRAAAEGQADAERRAAAVSRAAAAEGRAAEPERRAADAEAPVAGTEAPARRTEPARARSDAGGSSLADDERVALAHIARAAEELAAWLHRLAAGPEPSAGDDRALRAPGGPPPPPAGRPPPLAPAPDRTAGSPGRPPPPPPPPSPSPPGTAARPATPAGAQPSTPGTAARPATPAGPRPSTPGTAARPAAPAGARPSTPGGGQIWPPSAVVRSEAGRRRAPVRLPPGMVQDDPAAVEAMVRTPGVAVIVDGYNVSMLAWPAASAADQRERLCDALAEFQLRFRCEVTVVFDGAEVPGVRPLRRRGLRVVFSAAGQEADEVVVGEVVFRPEEVPVIVVSSDREVRAGAEAEGATVLPADALLQLMRR